MLKKYDKNGTEVNLLQDVDIESKNGYIKFPSGLMIQWGMDSVSEGSVSKTVTFAIPYVDGAYIQATPTYHHEITVQYAIGVTNNNFNFYREGRTYGITKPQSFYWQAIGRWK